MGQHSHAEELRNAHGKKLAALALGAIGIVFGDIGTSPLYTMKETLGTHGMTPQPMAVLGVLSLIFWSLLMVISLKYVTFVMRADNKGEGGIMALMALAPRLLIEITETAAITDLESAAKAIAALRTMGYRVGLDDFGAGSASIHYLHAFEVDFVKFDGAMTRKIGASKRDDALLAGLAKLCGEMGTTTIAEWIETKEMSEAAREMGFQHGQGKYLGAPMKEIPAAPQSSGRRRGVTESWG